MKKVILSSIFISAALFASANPLDSIGQKTVNGKNYVIYKVGSSETLYSLSKKYGTSVDDINAANDGLKEGLKSGATILIPSKAVVKAVEPSAPVVVPATPNNALSNIAAIHVVSTGETLYGISKKYNVTVDDIKNWNNMTTNDVTIGQELKVSAAGGTAPSKLNVNKAQVVMDIAKPTDISPDKTFTQVKATAVDPLPNLKYQVDSTLYGEEVVESKKLDKLSETGIDQDKNLAQYPGVKVGTILMVVNPINNKATFVRVVGPSTSGNIAVTSAVAKTLGLSADGVSKVSVSYTR